MDLKKPVTALVLLISLAAGLVLGYRQILPPAAPRGFMEQAAAPQQAQDGPDLALMLSHIKAMASQVHSVDSDGIRIAQTYLKDQLTKMGYGYREESYALSMEEIMQLERERTDYRKRPFTSTPQSIRSYAGIGDKPAMNLNNIVVQLDAADTQFPRAFDMAVRERDDLIADIIRHVVDLHRNLQIRRIELPDFILRAFERNRHLLGGVVQHGHPVLLHGHLKDDFAGNRETDRAAYQEEYRQGHGHGEHLQVAALSKIPVQNLQQSAQAVLNATEN